MSRSLNRTWQRPAWIRCLRLGLLLGWLWLLIPFYRAEAGSFISQTYNGRIYKIYIPDGYQAGSPIPLVVMLHGCSQDPDQFATGSEMNSYAEQYNFIAIYPEQPASANSARCWNWFEPAHQARGSGEPALIAGMVNQVKSNYTIDHNRVYVAGLSAGAAMSVILGTTYPDVFAAIGVGSGLEYKAATNSTSAWTVMATGGPDPVTQGNLAYNAMGSYVRVVPVIVFHGTSDYTVNVTNGHQVISQWAQTNDRASDGSDNNNIDDTAESTISGSVPGGRTYTQYIYHNSTTGTAVMEKYIVNSMGHAWSGGSSAGNYTDPQGPEASLLMWQFFTDHPMNGATPTPTPTPIPSATPTLGPSPTPTNTPVPTSTSAANQLTFASLAGEDGYVGALTADGYSTAVHKVGDKGMYNSDTYRTILSFDTSSLSDTTTITGATLRICRNNLQGSLTGIPVDIKSGSFGNNSALALADYYAAASAYGIATLSIPGANNQCSEAALTATALAHINLSGRTQFRLKGEASINFPSDVLTIYGGENNTYAPLLVVQYQN